MRIIADSFSGNDLTPDNPTSNNFIMQTPKLRIISMSDENDDFEMLDIFFSPTRITRRYKTEYGIRLI